MRARSKRNTASENACINTAAMIGGEGERRGRGEGEEEKEEENKEWAGERERDGRGARGGRVGWCYWLALSCNLSHVRFDFVGEMR